MITKKITPNNFIFSLQKDEKQLVEKFQSFNTLKIKVLKNPNNIDIAIFNFQFHFNHNIAQNLYNKEREIVLNEINEFEISIIDIPYYSKITSFYISCDNDLSDIECDLKMSKIDLKQ